jgi:hypothetical protein
MLKLDVTGSAGGVAAVYLIYGILDALVRKGVLSREEAVAIVSDARDEIGAVSKTDHKSAHVFLEGSFTPAALKL